MPIGAKKACAYPCCPEKVDRKRRFCAAHERASRAAAADYPNRDALYGRKWKKIAHVFLRQHPLCAYCLKAGQSVPASVVDHIKPHRGDAGLFWDSDNWQSLCTPCHSSVKQREEKTGAMP